MLTKSDMLSGRQVSTQLRRQALVPQSQRRSPVRTLVVWATYDVEAEPAPPRAPNSVPRFGGGPPPPPPPPPPLPPTDQKKPPVSRRDFLFAGLGLGLGILGTHAVENWPLEQATVDEKLTAILDDIMDDEVILNALGEEIINRRIMDQGEGYVSMLEGYKEISDQLDELLKQLEDAQGQTGGSSGAGR